MINAFILSTALAVSPGHAALEFAAPGEAIFPETNSLRAATTESLRAAGVTEIVARNHGYVRVRGATATAHFIDRLHASGIAGAEPNYYAFATAVIDHGARTWSPNDAYFPKQWNLRPMPAFWYLTRGNPAVVVAVLDTGIHVGSESPISLLPGVDIINGDPDPTDDNGHGTHMASIIAQATDNGLRAAGIAPDVSLLPVKVLDANGRGTVFDVAIGIHAAVDTGAHVINLSLALHPLITGSAVLYEAVTYAAARGVIVVAASGNHGAASVSLPAAFNETIAVGATNSGGTRSAYSNWGPELDLLAPGGDDVDRDLDGHGDGIAAFSFNPTTNQEGLYLGAGTSQAAAHVSGVAALLMSSGASGRDRLRALIQLTATPLSGSTGWTANNGYGSLDPIRAMGSLGTIGAIPSQMLNGWVADHKSTDRGPDWSQAVVAFVSHPSGLMLLVRDSTGTYAVVEGSGGEIRLYRLNIGLGGGILSNAGGLMALIDQAGGILALVDSMGGFLGLIDSAGGILALIDSSGGILTLIDSAGGVLAIVDSSGGILALIDSSGGILSLLDASGGFLALISSSGGMMSMVEGAGGVMALVDSMGGFLGLISSASHGLLDGLVEVAPDQFTSAGGRERNKLKR